MLCLSCFKAGSKRSVEKWTSVTARLLLPFAFWQPTAASPFTCSLASSQGQSWVTGLVSGLCSFHGHSPLPEQSSSPELLSEPSLWSQAEASCCKDCYFPCYENIWEDGYRKEWCLWDALYFSSFQNKQKSPYCPFLPHLAGKTLHQFFLATFPVFQNKVFWRNSWLLS